MADVLIDLIIEVLKKSDSDVHDYIESLAVVCYNSDRNIESFMDSKGHKLMLDTLNKTLTHTDFFFLLESLSTGNKYQIEKLLEFNILELILWYFINSTEDVIISCIKILGNIVLSSKKHGEFIVTSGIFSEIFEKFLNPNEEIRVLAIEVIKHFFIVSYEKFKIKALYLGVIDKAIEGSRFRNETYLENLLVIFYHSLSLLAAHPELEEVVKKDRIYETTSLCISSSNQSIFQKAKFILDYFFSL